MMITVKYFGQVSDVTHKKEEQITVEKGTITDVLAHLFAEYPELENIDFKVAQGQELVNDKVVLSGEEIALLPPFAGG